MEKIKNVVMSHPYLSAWVVLALGMVLILLYEAQNVGLEGSQWFWLITITILVAGACIWIISWGDDEDDPDLVEEETQTQDA